MERRPFPFIFVVLIVVLPPLVAAQDFSSSGPTINIAHSPFQGERVVRVFPAQVQVPQPFSADFTSTISLPKGTYVHTGKIYSSPPRIRREEWVNGQQSWANIYSDGKFSYMLVRAQHLYSENHPDQGPPEARALLAEKDNPCASKSPCTKAGTETVDGRLCEKWVVSDKNGTTTTWFDRRLSFAIKRTGPFGFVWQLTNITEGKQDASLFEVPADYKKIFDLPNIGLPKALIGPGPELKRLGYFMGAWKVEGNGTLAGPQANISEDAQYEWMPGGFFLIGHFDNTTTIGDIKGMAVMGYDDYRKVYTYHTYSSVGFHGLLKGTVDGDTWTWTPDMTESSTAKTRVTMKEVSETRYTFKVETNDGKAWRTIGEATATKVSDAPPAKDN